MTPSPTPGIAPAGRGAAGLAGGIADRYRSFTHLYTEKDGELPEEKETLPGIVPKFVRDIYRKFERTNSIVANLRYDKAVEEAPDKAARAKIGYNAGGQALVLVHDATRFASDLLGTAETILLGVAGVATLLSVPTAGASLSVAIPATALAIPIGTAALAAKFAQMAVAPHALAYKASRVADGLYSKEDVIEDYKDANLDLLSLPLNLLRFFKNLGKLDNLRKAAQAEVLDPVVTEWAISEGLTTKLQQWTHRIVQSYDLLKGAYDAATGVQTSLLHLVATFDDAGKAIAMGWKFAKRGAGLAWDGAKSVGKKAWEGTKAAGEATGEALTKAGHAAWDFGGRMWDKAKSMGSKAVDGAKGWWGAHGTWVKGKVWGGSWGAAAGAMVGGLPGAVVGGALGLVFSGPVPHDGDLTGPFGPDGELVTGLEPEAAVAKGATIFVNGINTSEDSHKATAMRIARETGRTVVGIYNATGAKPGRLGTIGVIRDVLQTAADKMGDPFHNPATATLKRLVLAYGDRRKKDGGLRIEAHSQGSVIVSEALRQCAKEGADLKGNDVTTWGNASWTFPQGPQYHHRVHDSDPVSSYLGTSSRLSKLIHENRFARRMTERLFGPIADAPKDTRVIHHGGDFIAPHEINREKGQQDYLSDRSRFEAAERRPGKVDNEANEAAAASAFVRPVGRFAARMWQKAKGVVQRDAGPVPGLSAPALLAALKTTGGGGAALGGDLRKRLAPSLGFDPGGARIHAGPSAQMAARLLQAEAFTIGRDVFFGASKHDPSSPKGLGLLAHELTHVGQQAGGGAAFGSGAGLGAMEESARAVGATVTQGFARGDGVTVEACQIDYDFLSAPKGDSRKRLDAISARALDEATRRLETLHLGDVRIDTLDVDVDLDLGKMTDSECVARWAEAIVHAVRSKGRPGVQAHFSALQLSEDTETPPEAALEHARRDLPGLIGGGLLAFALGSNPLGWAVGAGTALWYMNRRVKDSEGVMDYANHRIVQESALPGRTQETARATNVMAQTFGMPPEPQRASLFGSIFKGVLSLGAALGIATGSPAASTPQGSEDDDAASLLDQNSTSARDSVSAIKTDARRQNAEAASRLDRTLTDRQNATSNPQGADGVYPRAMRDFEEEQAQSDRDYREGKARRSADRYVIPGSKADPARSTPDAKADMQREIDAAREREREEVHRLSREILASPNITLASEHVSGVEDEASALQQVKDARSGRQARRSEYENAPGGWIDLDPRVLQGMLDLAKDYSFTVSEIAGGSHSAGSRHYAGIAFDVDTINGRPVSISHPDLAAFKQRARQFGAQELLGPPDPGHAGHVHLGWPR